LQQTKITDCLVCYGELTGVNLRGSKKKKGVAESRYEWQSCTHPKVSLGLGFKNPTKEDSYLKSATPVEWYSTPLSFPPRLSW